MITDEARRKAKLHLKMRDILEREFGEQTVGITDITEFDMGYRVEATIFVPFQEED